LCFYFMFNKPINNLMIRSLSIIILVVAAFLNVSAQQTKIEYNNTVRQALNALLKDENMQHATVGFVAKDMKTNEIIAEHNANISMATASTLKLISTATALEVFGPDFRFVTTIEYEGKIDKNKRILNGNIFIHGGGDPCLGSKKFESNYYSPHFMDSWVTAIKSAGIDSINGAIIGDDMLYSGEFVPTTWSWEDIGNYYGAGVSGLSIYDNAYTVEMQSGSQTTKILTIDPVLPELIFFNEVDAKSITKDNSIIYGGPYSNFRRMRGSIPKNKSHFFVRGAIHDPAYVCAYHLEKKLNENMIFATKTLTTTKDMYFNDELKYGTRVSIYQTYSPSLRDIVYRTNMWSMNLYAEHMINHIGLRRKNIGSSYQGILALKEFWTEKGMDTKGFMIYDGSGLSQYNAVTAEHFYFILKYMKYNSKYFTDFYNSMPIAGQTGTLASMCKGTYAQGNLHAKSGSIKNTRSYAGYVTTKSGREVAFSIMLNHFNCDDSTARKLLEKLMVAIADCNQ